MNIKQLEAFIYIAEENNFTKAAKLMFMTQPAISFQIKALEEELNIPLFERIDKKVYLTDGGRMLYPQAKQILANYEAIKDGVVALKGLEKGLIHIGASTIPGEYILPRLIAGFKAMYPGITVKVDIGSTGEILSKLDDRKIDIAVIGSKPKEEKLEVFQLVDDKLDLIAPKDFSKDLIEIQELPSLPYIFREKGSGTRKIIEEHFTSVGINMDYLDLIMELGSTRAIVTAVEAGLGFSIVSNWALKDALALGKVKVVQVEGMRIVRHLYGAVNPNKYNSSLTRAFQDFIKKELK